MTRFQQIDRRDRKNLVTINEFPVFVAEQDAIGIAIMRNADLRAALLYDALNLSRKSAAALGVDVYPVWFVVRDRQSGAEFPENARCRFVGSAVRDIDGDRHFLERHFSREAGFRELDVTSQRIVDASGAPDLSRRRANRIDLSRKDELFDLLLDLIVEFVAIVPEKFDSVVLVRIVGGGKHNARIRPE